ncbi:MAG: aspartate aminotransferase family protein [Acidimicrobiales bacterium]|nr:aspartate aminotransferase family protein [Acidimicrobiales bacterium]
MANNRTTPALLHPFGKPASNAYHTLVRAEGVRVWDDKGNEYIDALGSLWYCQVGYGRREIIDAITDQLTRMSTYNTFAPWANGPAEAAAERISSLSPLEGSRVFLCCSGSESVDTAIKLSRLVHQLRGDHDRQVVVRRTRGYHGVNVGGTSVQGIASNRENWGDLLPHVVEIDPDDIESAARLFAEAGDRIAAVISEPLQGAGGVYPPTEGYLERLRDLCTAHGALLVFDEVITGFGRTGNWFASQTYGVTPDLITFAKGVTSGYQPMGGVIVTRAVCDELEADPDFILRHGYTYSGHPAAAAAALANIDIIDNDGLIERAKHVGERLSAGLHAMAADGTLRDVRGVGAVWTGQLPETYSDARAIEVRDTMTTNGVICRAAGTNMVFCPPLVIEDSDIDRCVDVLAEAIRLVPGDH